MPNKKIEDKHLYFIVCRTLVRLYSVLPALYLLEPRRRKNSRPFSGRTGAEPRPALRYI